MGRKKLDPNDKLKPMGTALTLAEKTRCEEMAKERGWDVSDVLRYFIRLGIETHDAEELGSIIDKHTKGKKK